MALVLHVSRNVYLFMSNYCIWYRRYRLGSGWMVVSFRTRRMPELLTSPTAAFSLVVRSTLFLLSLGKHVVSNNIGSESNDGDAEAREDVPEHCGI